MAQCMKSTQLVFEQSIALHKKKAKKFRGQNGEHYTGNTFRKVDNNVLLRTKKDDFQG